MDILSWTDYINSALITVLPVLIGVYYGCYKKNHNTVSEYMYGGKTISIVPLSLSFLISHVSGVTLLDITDEVYTFGLKYCAAILSYVTVTIFIILFYLPVFYELQLNSPYEYLERRFNYNVRIFVLIIVCLSFILNFVVNLYIPAKAINTVSGIPTNTIAITVCLTCLLCTAWGGLKAVVWMQLLQIVVILCSLSFIIILSCMSIGYPNDIIKVNGENNRLEMFNMNLDPFSRNTFWTIAYGLTFQWLAQLSIHPMSIQRINAVSTQTDAKLMIIMFLIGATVITILSCFIGLLIYAKYHDCVLLMEQDTSGQREIFSYYILDSAKQFPSLKFLFITMMINVALSTTSAMLNTATGIVHEEIIVKVFTRKLSQDITNLTMKITVILLGIIIAVLFYAFENLNDIVQMAIQFTSLTNGALLFVFSFGMMFPWGTSKGALSGLTVSLLAAVWILLAAQSIITTERLKFPTSTATTEGCQINNFTSTSRYNQTWDGEIQDKSTEKSIPILHQIPFMYYTIITACLGMIVGLIVTYITGTENLIKLDANLIVPQLQKVITERQKYANAIVGYELVSIGRSNEQNLF